jgi:hypothetical protein
LGKLDGKKIILKFQRLEILNQMVVRVKKNYTNFLVVCIREIQISSSKHMSFVYEIIMQKNMLGCP